MGSKKGLNASTLEAIKKELLAKKASLTKHIDSELDEMASSEGHHLADMDDLGGDANDEETSFKILEMETAEVKEIDHALERIEAGEYGICESCNEAIGVARLKALPFTSHCIECKRGMESGRL